MKPLLWEVGAIFVRKVCLRLMVIFFSSCLWLWAFPGAALAGEGPAAEPPQREQAYTLANVPFIFLENLFPPQVATPFRKVPGFSKGSLTYQNYTHFGDTPQDKRRVRNEYLLELQHEFKVVDRFRLFAIPEFYFDDDALGKGSIDEPSDNDLRRNIFNFQEFYLDIYFNKFDLRLGKQIFAWGKADELNPTDNLGAKDQQDLFDDRDIGVLAARVNYYFGDYQVEAAIVPFFTPTRLPTRNSRFSLIPAAIPFPRKDPIACAQVSEITGVEYCDYGPSLVPVFPPSLPENKWRNVQWGIRVLRTIRGWDLSASYYDGIYHVPVARFVPLAPFFTFIGIEPSYEGVKVFGGDFATQFGKLGLRGETGYFVFDGNMDDDFVQYVLGLDYTFSDVIGDDDVHLLLQYAGEIVAREGNLVIPGLSSSIGRALSSAITMDLSYEFSEFLEITLDLIYLTDSNDSFLLRPKLKYEHSDRLTLTLQFDIPQGSRGTFFGSFRDSRRLYFSMKYAF